MSSLYKVFEMSMISELVDKLKKYATEYDIPPFGREVEGTSKFLLEAAITIETLSAKLTGMERKAHYNGGWIACEDRLPEIMKPVLVCDKQGNVCIRAITCKIKGKKYWSQDKDDVIAWQPLPEPYHL